MQIASTGFVETLAELQSIWNRTSEPSLRLPELIGERTTGNSTGNLYSTVEETLQRLRSHWNDDVVQAVVSSRAKAIDHIEEWTKRFQIQCDFQRTGFHYYAETETDEVKNFLSKELSALKDVGLATQRTSDFKFPVACKDGLVTSHQAQFNPLKYVRALANILNENWKGRCELFENSPVIEIDGKNGILKTSRGSVHAEAIFMATHTPKGVRFVHTLMRPIREFGLAAETSANLMDPGIFWRVEQPKFSVRSYVQNEKTYLIAVGGEHKTGHDEKHSRLKELQDYFEKLAPSSKPCLWAAQSYRTADGLPYNIGPIHPKLFIATGFATDGLVYGTLSALFFRDWGLISKLLCIGTPSKEHGIAQYTAVDLIRRVKFSKGLQRVIYRRLE